jgi:DNA-directed RNA polymerase specialized sigma subunit
MKRGNKIIDQDARDDLILEYLPYAKGIAFNIHRHRQCPFSLLEDCMSAATEALIKAIDSYQEFSGASLKTWINKNVQLTVMNFIKKEVWDIPVAADIEDYLNSTELLCEDNAERTACNKDLICKVLFFIEQTGIRQKGDKTRKRKKQTEHLLAHLMDGYLIKEIADWRGCSPTNVSLMVSGLKDLIVKHFKDDCD